MQGPKPLTFLALFVLSLPCTAQSAVVSPTVSATIDGNTSNVYPWIGIGTTFPPRYQQIHSDLRGTARMVTRLAWRRDGPAPFNTMDTRTVDCEVLMSHSARYDTPSWVFANNYIGTPTVVVPRTMLVLGPFVTPGSPAAFELKIPLVTPFPYNGNTSLLWEARIHGMTGMLSTAIDGDTCSSATTAAPTTTGTGCTVTGRPAPVTLTIQHFDSAGTYEFGGHVQNGPANAPVLFSLGTTNPNQTISGLCSNLLTNLFQVFIVGVTDATGFVGAAPTAVGARLPSGAFCFAFPNSIPGARLFGQAHAINVASTLPIPVANSDGKSWIVPFPNPARVIEVTRLYNLPPATQSSPDAFLVSTNVGFGVVTEFQHR